MKVLEAFQGLSAFSRDKRLEGEDEAPTGRDLTLHAPEMEDPRGATGLEGTQELWETAQALTDVVSPPSPQFFIVVKYI